MKKNKKRRYPTPSSSPERKHSNSPSNSQPAAPAPRLAQEQPACGGGTDPGKGLLEQLQELEAYGDATGNYARLDETMIRIVEAQYAAQMNEDLKANGGRLRGELLERYEKVALRLGRFHQRAESLAIARAKLKEGQDAEFERRVKTDEFQKRFFSPPKVLTQEEEDRIDCEIFGWNAIPRHILKNRVRAKARELWFEAVDALREDCNAATIQRAFEAEKVFSIVEGELGIDGGDERRERIERQRRELGLNEPWDDFSMERVRAQVEELMLGTLRPEELAQRQAEKAAAAAAAANVAPEMPATL